MVTITRTGTIFAFIERPVRLDRGWPGEEFPEHVLAGPVLVDVFNASQRQGRDDLLQQLEAGTILAGTLLEGWQPDDIKKFRSALWRSAHKFIVENVHLVDRGPELEELARLLKVDD